MENKEKVEDVSELDAFKPGMFIILLAKRFFGKTTICKQIIKNLIQNHKFSGIYLISNTASFNGSYDGIVKKANIFAGEVMDEVFTKIMDHQKKSGKKRKNVIIIIDDVDLSQVSKKLSLIASAGRHFGLTVCMNVQYGKIFTTSIIRNNCDLWLIGEISKKSLQEIFESFVTRFHDFKTFYQWYRENVIKPIFFMYNNRESKRDDRLSLVTCEYDEKIIINTK